MNPKITVLLAVYNGLPYVKETIESTLNQTYHDFEFLIIDDCSTDGTTECIFSYNDPRIRLIKNDTNIGQPASLNKGLLLARGEYIARLDGDDVNLPCRLEEQLNFLENRPDISIVCSWERSINSKGKLLRDWKKSIDNYGVFLGEIILGLCPVWHPSVMYRKNDVLRLGSYEPSYGPAEDYHLWSRMSMERLGAYILPKFHLLQRLHNQRLSIVKLDVQIRATAKAQLNVIKNFSDNTTNTERMAALLRLEKEHITKNNNKKNLIELSEGINEMLVNINKKFNLTNAEFKSLKSTIRSRVGSGFIYAKKFSLLPEPIFSVVYYALSPLLLTKLKAILSHVNNKQKELLYRFYS